MGKIDYVFRNCLLCDTKNEHLIVSYRATAFVNRAWTPIEVRVTRCRHCGFVYNNRVPDQASLDFIYENISRSSMSDSSNHEQNNRDQAAYVERFIKRESGRALDVGSGLDSFSQILRSHGWTIYELEPSKALVESATPEADCVIRTSIEAFDFSHKFELVSLRGVLEHLYDPVYVLKKGAHHLSDAGILFIEVPNLQKAQPCGIESYFNFLHLYHFTPVTLGNMIDKAGLEIVDCATDARYGSIRLIAEKRATPSAARGEITVDRASDDYLIPYFALERSERKRVLERIRRAIRESHLKVIIWGAGFHTEALLREDASDIIEQVDCLVDSDGSKWQTRFCGKEVRPPAYCLENRYPIVISSLASQEAIENAILSSGFEKERIVKLYGEERLWSAW